MAFPYEEGSANLLYNLCDGWSHERMKKVTKKKGISLIPDTAFVVAYCRAQESKRKDALFNDHLAERLIGTHGKKVMKAMPREGRKYLDWNVAIRTIAMDRLIKRAVRSGIDTVVNLGAGLDTRPYRMKLPKKLRWIEVDYAPMMELKNEVLKSEKPHCQVERVGLDLAQEKVRRPFLRKIGMGSKKVLVVTEGLLLYLTEQEARELSKDLLKNPKVKYWLLEYNHLDSDEDSDVLPVKFKRSDWIPFFMDLGWKFADVLFALDESKRVGRAHPFKMPTEVLKKINPQFGYVVFGKKA